MAFSYLRQIWEHHKKKDAEENSGSEQTSRSFVLMHEGIPCQKITMPTRRLIDQKHPHEYVPEGMYFNYVRKESE